MMTRIRRTSIYMCSCFAIVCLVLYVIVQQMGDKSSNFLIGNGNWFLGSQTEMVKPNTSPIFIAETSGKSYMTLRETCAIESVSRHHPHRNITLYSITALNPNDIYWHVLEALPNLHIRLLNLTSLFHETPLATWHQDNTIQESSFPTQHLSDAVRLAILWRFGGTYFDSDVIALRSTSEIRNALGLQSKEEVNSAVMVFDQWHPFLYECMTEYVRNYSKIDYANQGPGLVTPLMRKSCHTDFLTDVLRDPESCKGINLYSERAFYPIPWFQWPMLFDRNSVREVDLSKSYTVHLWGRMSRDTPTRPGAGNILEILFKKNCPESYKWMEKQNVI